MGLGLHGQPGAGAARPVVEEQQLDRVPAKDPTSMVGGTHAWGGAETTKIVKLGNAQVKISIMPLSCLSVCDQFCPTIFRPVCGSDGVTYNSKCLLEKVSFSSDFNFQNQ